MLDRFRTKAYAALGLALVVFAILNWTTTFRELHRYYTNMWIWDQWDYLSHFDAYRQFDLGVLWIQHNEHREIGTELTYWLDILLFQGRQIVPEISGIVAYIAALLVVVICAFNCSGSWRLACAGLLATAIAGYKLCVDSLNTPFLTSWPQWEFFVAAALASIVLHNRRSGRLFLFAAIAFAVAATYSMSNGMLVWPLLLLAALVLQLERRETWAVIIFASVSIGLYFFHYKNLHSIGVDNIVHNPAYFLEFVAALLGMPFSTANYQNAPILLTAPLGFAALTLIAVDSFYIARRKLFNAPPVIVLGGFCALVLASVCLTALGRMNPNDPLITAARAGRYITEPTLFWCSLLMLSVWLIGEAWKGYAALLFLTLASLLTLWTLHRNRDFYGGWNNYFQRGQWAAIAFGNGLTEETISQVIFPSRDYFLQFKHVLIDNHLAIFADPQPGWIGRSTKQVFSRGLDGYIHGEVTSVRKLGNDFEIQGWADGVTTVVFADEAERVIGFGMRPRAGPAELYTHDVPEQFAFTGFIRGEFGARQFSLWAVDRKFRKIYRMGKLRNILPY